jgi:hypothetical protein
VNHTGHKFPSGRKDNSRSFTPGPGRYTPGDLSTQVSCKFGTGPQIDFYKNSDTPGHKYSPNWDTVLPSDGRAVFGKEKQRADYRKSYDPGPIYNPKLPGSGASVSIPKDQRFRARKSDTPGPKYDPRVYDSIRDRNVTFGKESRDKRFRNENPGPGQYCISDWYTRAKTPAAIIYLTDPRLVEYDYS